ncbi:hypothetical protein PPYR_14027 [Photinus pyralis]|uniref:Protein lines n=1 Tax=Photinus pyralis TaxID=7054 RepID=A0A5N4A424_PHOPY|nr:protein lines [Photinus pyralis]KAB0792066.1 hypothetical protein PPYR_14027 [Photinus pyralis]
MVLHHRKPKMSSEQPVKKKLRRTDDTESTDEPDYIHSLTENGMSALHLSMPPNINEADLNTLNEHLHGVLDCNTKPYILNLSDTQPLVSSFNSNHDRDEWTDLEVFQNGLIEQCLCGVPENLLRKPFAVPLTEWPTGKLLQLLSNLQLLFDVYLKQNNNGHICSRIVAICVALVNNEYNLIQQLLSLTDTRNCYVNYLLSRVISSFLIIAKTDINHDWLEMITNYLSLDYVDYDKMNFGLEVIRRVVEWKDVEIHVLEEPRSQDAGSGATTSAEFTTVNCTSVQYHDSESFDTSPIKGLVIRSLESKWFQLINRVQGLIENNRTVHSQTCILAFLSLWESIISVKANLSVIDTKPFYAHLESFASLFLSSVPLPPIIWKQLLSLFNEVLCYGSTLALQDMLPDDTCKLAYVIVRYVKDARVLERLPYRCNEGYRVHGFIGTIPHSQASQLQVDKTLLQKMVLLVLKSVAVTVKETRTDSSDSSVGSDDYDYYQDMQLIERSIRDVLKKVDVFVKASLDFHPETQFAKLLIHLFSDQDDYMIESMVCTLDITVGISYRNAVFPDLVNMLNPVYAFVEFLKVVSHDSDVLLDYLVSNETCFLLYLLRFLKYIRRNWSKFVSSCESAGTGELGNTMTVLIRLNMQINRLVSKDLFPYNISPVLRLLEVCENLYESNDSS